VNEDHGTIARAVLQAIQAKIHLGSPNQGLH
jgi:hypothetical protein